MLLLYFTILANRTAKEVCNKCLAYLLNTFKLPNSRANDIFQYTHKNILNASKTVVQNNNTGLQSALIMRT